MMPNMMPVARAGRIPGVFYNTGHGHLGWTLSAATAQIVAEAIDGWSDLCAPSMVPSQVDTTKTTHAAFL
jgi:D-amino-acid dehydrogenase